MAALRPLIGGFAVIGAVVAVFVGLRRSALDGLIAAVLFTLSAWFWTIAADYHGAAAPRSVATETVPTWVVRLVATVLFVLFGYGAAYEVALAISR